MKLEVRNFYWRLFGIIAFSLALFIPLVHCDFINWDDGVYVYENSLISNLNFKQIRSIFLTINVFGNYHPITILSLAVDYYFGGLNPSVYHFTNIIFHLFNTALLAIFLKRLFQQKKLALFVALLFAIHPMHLEAVAWISSRKDVLYVFFFLLSLIAYLHFLSSKKLIYYYLCLLLFIFSILSKGMAVVLAPILLLIDNYKLGLSKTDWLNKIPFFIISLVFGLLVIYNQDASSAIPEVASLSLFDNIIFAGYSIGTYMIKVILPINLSILYPYPLGGTPSVWMTIFGIFTYVFCFFTLYYFRKNRQVFFGLLFFLICIFPVSQLLPVGSTIVAERYTYLSYLGLFIVLGSFIFIKMKEWKEEQKTALKIGALLFVVLLTFQTYSHIPTWKNSETVWSNAIKANEFSYFSYSKRGTYYAKIGDLEQALSDYNQALSIYPYENLALTNRANIFSYYGEYDLAINDLVKAIEVDSNFIEAHLNLGNCFLSLTQFEEAKKEFLSCIKLDSGYFLAHLNLGVIAEKTGETNKAFGYYEKAKSLQPESWIPPKYIASLAFKNGNINLAKENINIAYQLNPQQKEIQQLRTNIVQESRPNPQK